MNITSLSNEKQNNNHKVSLEHEPTITIVKWNKQQGHEPTITITKWTVGQATQPCQVRRWMGQDNTTNTAVIVGNSTHSSNTSYTPPLYYNYIQ